MGRGRNPCPCGPHPRSRRPCAGVDAVVVDLTARAYDGVAAVAAAHAAGRPVIAVGQHDDAALRRRALDAGAARVHPYRRLFEDGPRQLAAWLATVDPQSASVEAPA